MKITALGHSCFLVEIAGDRPEPVRILVDPWITDHVVGDLCGRFPRIRIDFDALPPIDAVYLSHSHTDHFDPYSLLELRDGLPAAPRLLLPISCAYLEEVLDDYLPEWPRTVLAEAEPIVIEGVEISALFNLAARATNEDDVMILVVRNAHEVLVSESDALLPFAEPDARELIASLFMGLDDDAGPPSRVFITTKNELGATMRSLRATDAEGRRAVAAESAAETMEEIEGILAPASGEIAAPWDLPGAVRLVIGQGIAVPHEVDPEWNRVLFPISLADRVRFEQQSAAAHGYDFPIEAMSAGDAFEIRGGAIERDTAGFLEVLDQEGDRAFDPTIDRTEEEFPVSPLRDDPRDLGIQRELVREVLMNRFFPWWIGARNPPVEHVLAATGGEYRIRIRYGTSSDFEFGDYAIGFGSVRFTVVDPVDDVNAVHEEYWANDIEDYLTGRADDFSTFCRRPPGGRATHVWDCLGMPYLNDDLVARKHRHHFARAASGKTAADWVLGVWRGEMVE